MRRIVFSNTAAIERKRKIVRSESEVTCLSQASGETEKNLQ